MIALDNGDKIRGDAAAATVVDYTLHGVVGSVVTQLADGQLAATIGDLYTAASAGIAVTNIVLVNTDSSARAVNLYLTPSGGTARRFIPKGLSLAAGYSLHTDGNKTSVIDTSGQIVTAYAHAMGDLSNVTITSAADHDMLYYNNATSKWINGVAATIVANLGITASIAELNYVDGVTSAIQTQMNLKAPLASPTFTGTVTIPTPFTIAAVSMTATGTQLNYLASATGTTGTANTNVVFSTSPTLVTPALGTPASGVLSSCTGYPLSALTGAATLISLEGITIAAGTLIYGTAADTVAALGAGATTTILVGGGAAAPVWTTATGSGAPVRATSPTLTTPTLNGTTVLGSNPRFNLGSGEVYFDTTGAGGAGIIIITTTDGATGAKLHMRHTSANPAVNDTVGYWVLQGYDDASGLTSYGNIECRITNVAAATKASKWRWNLYDAGGATVPMQLYGAGGLLLLEGAAAGADVAAYGQFWVKNDAPNIPMFTDDAGADHAILTGATGTKHEFHLPFEDPTGAVGNWDVVAINSAQDTHFTFQVAESFQSLVNAKVVMIPDTTETIQWDIYVSVAAAGEAYNNDDRSALNETLAVTADQLTEVDISGQLTGLAAGDYVGIDFQSDTADLRIIGFEFDYL